MFWRWLHSANCLVSAKCSGFKDGSASLLINANATVFANRSTSQLAQYMANPVTHGTTCMVHPLSPPNHCHPLMLGFLPYYHTISHAWHDVLGTAIRSRIIPFHSISPTHFACQPTFLIHDCRLIPYRHRGSWLHAHAHMHVRSTCHDFLPT